MDPKSPSEKTPENRSLLPENQENEYEEHALVKHKSIENTHCDDQVTKESKTLEAFKTKVLEFARNSRMSSEHILLIEQSFPDFFPDLHVPDHPPYAAMIHKAITKLDEAGGSTEEAISLFIRKEQNDLPWAHATLLKHHLQKLCENGDVVVTGEKCYMLNTSCVTYNRNQIEAVVRNRIVVFNPNQINASPIPSPCSSPSSSSSSSYSDYTPNAKRRKQNSAGRKYGKKRHTDRRKPESDEEYEDYKEEHSEETEEEEESEEYEDPSEEFYDTEEEVEVTEVENQLIKYKGKHTHRTEGAKKNKTEEKSEFRDEHVRVVPVKNQVNVTYNKGTKLGRGRGRPPKCPKLKTLISPKEAQMELIEKHNQVAEVAKRLKQKRGRGRPSKNIGFETQTRPEETHQLRGVLNRPKQSRERSNPPKEIGTDIDIAPKEVHKEVMKALNQATDDLKRPREKRGRGRPPKNSENDTNIGQKEGHWKVIDAHDQMDSMEKPKQKRRPGRPPKNSGGPMVVFEVHNQTTEDGMKVKQERRQERRRFRRKHERIEVNKYLDQLELTVLEEMFGRMKIQSCGDGENVCDEVFPSSPCKTCETVMEDKVKKEREEQIQSSARGVELFDKHDCAKLPERSQILEDVEKLSWTPIQLPQEGTEDDIDTNYHGQSRKSETDEYTTMKELAPSQVVNEEKQPECIGQGGPPGFEHVTTIAPLTVSNYQHEDVRQQQILVGKKQLLEAEEETSTFMELLHQQIGREKMIKIQTAIIEQEESGKIKLSSVSQMVHGLWYGK
ncbi:hypothetical protein POM88_030842 [Heracleum sosnowskyi]|uniref:H15 domain-containing protein n=1 Tax=Heracleum sosnowskyi TaxID=360622 RepID=A0AAD8HW97_9APIA|nr:hypothetical protein POM88_030842 [Heracleum sosnowskyi]